MLLAYWPSQAKPSQTHPSPISMAASRLKWILLEFYTLRWHSVYTSDVKTLSICGNCYLALTLLSVWHEMALPFLSFNMTTFILGYHDNDIHPPLPWQLTRSHVGAPWWSSCRKLWLIVILVIDDDDDSDYIAGINVSPPPALGCGPVSCLHLQNVPLLGLTVQGNLHPDLTTHHVYREGRFIVWIKVAFCRHREVKFTTLDEDSCIGTKLSRPISIGCRYLPESWWVAILYVENVNFYVK